MKKLVNYCSIILLLLLATSQVKAQSVDVDVYKRQEEIMAAKESQEAAEAEKRLAEEVKEKEKEIKEEEAENSTEAVSYTHLNARNSYR